eukprot:CFRG3348T1
MSRQQNKLPSRSSDKLIRISSVEIESGDIVMRRGSADGLVRYDAQRFPRLGCTNTDKSRSDDVLPRTRINGIGGSQSQDALICQGSLPGTPRNVLSITNHDVSMIKETADLLSRRSKSSTGSLRMLCVRSNAKVDVPTHNIQQVVEMLLSAETVTEENECMLTAAMIQLYDTTSKFEKDSAALMMYTVLLDCSKRALVFDLFYTLHKLYQSQATDQPAHQQIYSHLLELLIWMDTAATDAVRTDTELWCKSLKCVLLFSERQPSIPLSPELLCPLVTRTLGGLTVGDEVGLGRLLLAYSSHHGTYGAVDIAASDSVLCVCVQLFLFASTSVCRTELFRHLLRKAFNRLSDRRADMVHLLPTYSEVLIDFLVQSDVDHKFQDMAPVFPVRFVETLATVLLSPLPGTIAFSLREDLLPEAAPLLKLALHEMVTIITQYTQLHNTFLPSVDILLRSPHEEHGPILHEIVLLFSSQLEKDVQNGQAFLRSLLLLSKLECVCDDAHVINLLMDRIASRLDGDNSIRAYAQVLNDASSIFQHKDQHDIKNVSTENMLKWISKHTKLLRPLLHTDVLTQMYCTEAFIKVAVPVPDVLPGSSQLHLKHWHGLFTNDVSLTVTNARLCEYTSFVSIVRGIASNYKTDTGSINNCNRLTWSQRVALFTLSVACSRGKSMFDRLGGFKNFKPLISTYDPVIAWLASVWALARFKADHPNLYEDLRKKIWGRRAPPPDNPYQRMSDLLNFKQQFNSTPRPSSLNSPCPSQESGHCTPTRARSQSASRPHLITSSIPRAQPSVPTNLRVQKQHSHSAVSPLSPTLSSQMQGLALGRGQQPVGYRRSKLQNRQSQLMRDRVLEGSQ